MILTVIGLCVFFIGIIILAQGIGEKKQIKDKTSDLNRKATEAEERYQSKIESINIIDQNIAIEKEQYEKCEKQLKNLHEEIDGVTERHHELIAENSRIQGRIEGAKQQLQVMSSQVEEGKTQLEIYKESNQELLGQYKEELKGQLEQLRQAYESEADILEEVVRDLREKRSAAILQSVADYENQAQMNFYMLQISDQDLNDINLLKQIEPKLNNKEVLGKLIYKTYIEKYYTDLIGRVLNKEHFSGIYKITNQANQMCYVGQAADISKRWQQHIKRAVGAEPLTHNKLYPAMQKWGVECFSFEVIDRCEKDKLNEREQYWQEFYGAKTFGYSIK